jgi:hypothetical protein
MIFKLLIYSIIKQYSVYIFRNFPVSATNSSTFVSLLNQKLQYEKIYTLFNYFLLNDCCFYKGAKHA